MSDNDDVPSGTMQSVLRSLKALESIADLQPAGLTQLARSLSLPKPTVSRILKTLEHAGWVAPQGNPGEVRWIITPRALAVGSNTGERIDLRTVARPVLSELGMETDENIHLSVPDGNMLVLIDKVHSSRSVQTVSQIGERAPMYMTASGWAFLSTLEREEIGLYLPKQLVAATSLTITDRGELLDAVDDVRATGYAINPGRWRADVAAVAAAVVDRSGRSLGALSISMPSYRLTPELHEPYGVLIRSATRKLSARL